MVREGARVAYTGMDTDHVVLGDTGSVLAVEGSVAHVKWASGSATGAVVPVYAHDLSVVGGRVLEATLADSLEVGTLMAFSARRSFDEGGEVAVLNQMVAHGHMAFFSAIAEEALTLVTSRIRTEPSMRAVLADLDEEEGEGVLRLAAACLIRDAFDDGDE